MMAVDAGRTSGCDLLKLNKTDLAHIGLSCFINITDPCVFNVAHESRKLISVDLNRCKSLTDAGISALGHGCNQLQSINLSVCSAVTDIGISALV